MLKESKFKKSYVTKRYTSINKFETKELKKQIQEDKLFTKKILSKKPDGKGKIKSCIFDQKFQIAKMTK